MKYIISSIDENSNLISYLYSREYQLKDIKKNSNGVLNNSIIAFTNLSDDELRKDALHIMEFFNIDHIIIKYDNEIKNVYRDGKELSLDITRDINETSYICDYDIFSFIPKKQYIYPKIKSQLSNNMIVEMLLNNKWVNHKIENLDIEYENIFNLMIKYEKLRFIK